MKTEIHSENIGTEKRPRIARIIKISGEHHSGKDYYRTEIQYCRGNRFATKLFWEYTDAIGEIDKIKNRNAEQAKMKKEFVPNVKVGDIFVADWGYDQTNIDFYKVIAMKKKTATFVKLANRWVNGSQVVPDTEIYPDWEIKARIMPYTYNNRVSEYCKLPIIRGSSYKETAFKWDDKPLYCTRPECGR